MEDGNNASATLPAELAAISFDEALTRLNGLLESTGWPRDIVWVEPTAYRVVPAAMHGRGKWHMLVLLRPSPIPNPEFARRQFEAAQASGLLVRLYALAHQENRLTFAVIEAAEKQGQGEIGFNAGVKVLSNAFPHRVFLRRNRFLWWLGGHTLELWESIRDHDLAQLVARQNIPPLSERFPDIKDDTPPRA